MMMRTKKYTQVRFFPLRPSFIIVPLASWMWIFRIQHIIIRICPSPRCHRFIGQSMLIMKKGGYFLHRLMIESGYSN